LGALGNDDGINGFREMKKEKGSDLANEERESGNYSTYIGEPKI